MEWTSLIKLSQPKLPLVSRMFYMRNLTSCLDLQVENPIKVKQIIRRRHPVIIT